MQTRTQALGPLKRATWTTVEGRRADTSVLCCLLQYGEGTLRLTTRQCYQLHGVLKHDLKTVFSSVIKAMGSTLGACGDVNRNVLSPPVRPESAVQYTTAFRALPPIWPVSRRSLCYARPPFLRPCDTAGLLRNLDLRAPRCLLPVFATMLGLRHPASASCA